MCFDISLRNSKLIVFCVDLIKTLFNPCEENEVRKESEVSTTAYQYTKGKPVKCVVNNLRKKLKELIVF